MNNNNEGNLNPPNNDIERSQPPRSGPLRNSRRNMVIRITILRGRLRITALVRIRDTNNSNNDDNDDGHLNPPNNEMERRELSRSIRLQNSIRNIFMNNAIWRGFVGTRAFRCIPHTRNSNNNNDDGHLNRPNNEMERSEPSRSIRLQNSIRNIFMNNAIWRGFVGTRALRRIPHTRNSNNDNNDDGHLNPPNNEMERREPSNSGQFGISRRNNNFNIIIIYIRLL